MILIKSTAEILAFKVLNRNVDEKWVQWAVDIVSQIQKRTYTKLPHS